MKDFVSAILIPHGLPWTGLAWASFGSLATALLAMRSTHSVRQVIQEIDTGPRLTFVVLESTPCS